jgi:BirA family biotin operon repressor/biotin-[acetyl-CoA-carboxylase] ligase
VGFVFLEFFLNEAPFEPLDATAIEERVSPDVRCWIRELRVHQQIDSTNTHLVRRASSEPIDGVVCFAESQTGGRGRRGRTWLSPKGQSIAVSLGHDLEIPISEVGPLSLVVGIGVAAALLKIGVEGVRLKWPNDILLDGAKAGGILIELARVGQPLAVVVGIGLNVGGGGELRERLGMPIGDLREKAKNISRNALAAALLDGVHQQVVELARRGFAPLRGRWEELHEYQDKPVLLIGANETVEGIARGVSLSGELILETAEGLSHFSGGEVSLRGSPL